jgi:hypothetical protein
MMIQTAEIVLRLQQDYHFQDKGDYLRGGVCPECGKKELFISKLEPHHLKCGRDNKCGWGIKTRDLYPELWKPLHELYPPTPADPTATAKAYLHSRGLKPALFAGQFVQGQRYEREAVREPKGTETVRFFLTEDKIVWWERFIVPIETPEGLKKAHFNGKYKGMWWEPAGFNPESGDKVFLTEGILDALSITQSGFKAVSLMSSNNWPELSLEAHLGKGIRWIVALDNDPAGQRYNLKFYRKLTQMGEKAEVCTAPDKDKRDWNDLLKESGGQIRSMDLEKWFYAGELLTAPNAKSKALLIQAHTNRHRFPFEFDKETYWGTWSDKDEDEPIKVQSIANGLLKCLYFQKNAITNEAEYYLSLLSEAHPHPIKAAFAPSSIATASAFKARLLSSVSGLMYTGNDKQLEAFIKEYWGTPPTVKTINFQGYSRELKGWVFQKQAVFNGKLHQLNEQDFFALPDNRQVKTTFKQDSIQLGTVEDAHHQELWLDDFRSAFGVKGLVALAWWAGAFFAEQLRALAGAANPYSSYPFLELSGIPGTGKTTLLVFLWKLSGRDNYEGIELDKANPAARWREFAKFGNLPLVAMEGALGDATKHKKGGFNLSETKGLYQGRGMKSRGESNNGNETIEPPFRGAFAIAQNSPVMTEDAAVMERIVQQTWDKSHFSSAGWAASNRLSTLLMEDINGFMTACITQEKMFMDKFQDGYQDAVKKLESTPELSNQRIRHNHAQLMGLIYALKAAGILALLLPSDLEMIDTYLTRCCHERHQCLQSDTALVNEFWDTVEYLESYSNLPVNHSSDPTLICISIPHFIEQAKEANQPLPTDLNQLKKELRMSKRYLYVDYVLKHSKLKKKSLKCFVFANKEGRVYINTI